jgi:hypothetical protein
VTLVTRRFYQGQHFGNLLALLVSATAAALAPLQVFLFAYAFIGPLHYLTEMAWLRKKNFYSDSRSGLLSSSLYVIAAIALCLAVSLDFYLHRGITAYSIALLVLLSLSTRVRDPRIFLALLATGLLARYFVHGFVLFIGAILPTIVHVYVFTFLFMVSGVVRESQSPKSRPAFTKLLAWLNPILLLALPVLLLTLHTTYPSPSQYWLTAEAGFADLHGYLVHLLGSNLHPDASILATPAAAAVLRFLAFIYLFHYLNWFTKTELLQWHRVSRRSWTVILALYALSIGCYLWNFLLGFYIVNFLSLLHVFLEFPLNWHTGQFLTSSLTRLWRRPATNPVTN